MTRLTEIWTADRDERAQRRPGVVLFLCCLAQFMTILDVSVVNVAIPSIKHDLGFSPSGLAWVINAYTLLFAGFLLLGGRAGDFFGRRRMYLIGLGLFTVTSLFAGFANSQSMLVISRAVQGFGGAVLAPTTLAILATTYRDRAARAKAMGVWSAVGSAGGLVGTMVGGLLTEELTWRWIFFINVPVGALTLIAAFVLLPESKAGERRGGLDVTGALLSTAGLMGIVYGMVHSADVGWTAPSCLAPLIGGVALIGAFVLNEGRLASSPLMPLRLFSSRALSGANLVQFGVAAATFPIWYMLSLYFQSVHGYSALRTGVAFVPTTVTIALGAQVASRLIGRVGTRYLLIISTTGMVVTLFVLGHLHASSSFWPDVIVPASAAAFFMGLGFTPLAFSATSSVAPQEAGIASGMLNTARQVGASIGLALVATVSSARVTSLMASGHVSGAVALNGGLTLALRVTSAVAILAVLSSFALPNLSRAHAEYHDATPARSGEGVEELEAVTGAH